MTLRDPNAKRETRELVQQVSRYATVGLEMGLSVALCIVAGRYLDNKLNTAPWFVLAGVGLGLAAAGRCLYRAAKRASKEFD